MAFGQPVKVSRQVVRVLVDRKQIWENDKPNETEKVTGFIHQRSAGYAPLYRAVIGYPKRARYDHPSHYEGDGWSEWPGIGISEADAPLPKRYINSPKSYDVEPSTLGSVRFRRIECPPTSGIVVGEVFLQEGNVSPGSSGGWDGEPEPPYFSQERRVRLSEVAIETEDKARLMLCWRHDLSHG